MAILGIFEGAGGKLFAGSARFNVAIRGDLKKFLEDDAKAAAGAVQAVIRRRTTVLRDAVRRQMRSAGLGDRLGKAIKDYVFPTRGASISAKGRLVSKAIYKRPGGSVDLLTVFDEGATVRAADGKYLALQIGTNIQFGSNYRAKQVFIDPKTMVLLKLRSGNGYLVVRRGGRGADRHGNYGDPILILLKQVTIKKKLDLQAALDYATTGLDELIVAEWERRAGKAGILDAA